MRPITTAMVLAAGRGERLSPLSFLRPKPLFPLWGRPLLYLTIDSLLRAGVERVVVNACHLAEQIERAVAEYQPLEGPLRAELIVSREKELLGGGGGLRQAAQYLDNGPFYVINSDVITDLDPVALAEAHLAAGSGVQATMALVERPELANVSVGANQSIIGFRSPETLPGELQRLAYGSRMVCNPEFLSLLPPGFSDTVTVLQQALARGAKVKGPLFKPGYWRNIDSPRDYFLAHHELNPGPQPKPSEQSPSKGAGWSGWYWVAPEAEVAADARLKNVIIWPEAKVEPGAFLQEAVIYGRVSHVHPNRGWISGRAESALK